MLIPGKNLKIGEVVMMVENNTPSYTWRLARVTDIFPGSDDRVRVVEVKDANKKIFERSVRQLVKLPVAGAEQDDESSHQPTMNKPEDDGSSQQPTVNTP